MIAGFPTETDEHHRANLSIIHECEIVHGHIFPYSPRPGTPAARMPQIERSTIKMRAAELRIAVSEVRGAWLGSLLGKEQSVLAERDGTGYAPNFARVSVPQGIAAGQIATISPERVIEGMLV